MYRRAPVDLALDANLAAMRLDEMAHEMQADAEARNTAAVGGAIVRLEDPIELLQGDPDAVVGHRDLASVE